MRRAAPRLARGLASAWLTLVAGPLAARAESPPVTPLEVVVQGPSRADPGTAVDVLPEERIARTGAPSVAEALESLPAVHSGGGSRGERILQLRGFDQRQLAVFVDGVPVYVPYDGQIDLGKIPVDQVQRLVVIKGAAPLLYGPNGLGGAVHVVTRSPRTRPSAAMLTEASALGAYAFRSRLWASATLGPVGAIVGAGVERALYQPMSAAAPKAPNEDGGRRDNSDRLAGNAHGKVVWGVDGRNRLALSATHVQGNHGVPPAVRGFNVRRWRWTDWTSTSVSLSHARRAAGFETEEVAYFARLGNTLDSFDDATLTTQDKPRAFHSVYDETAAGGFVRARVRAPIGASRTLELRTWLGLKHDRHVGQGDRDEPLTAVSTTLLTAASQAELDLVPRWLRVSAALQLDGEAPGASPSGPTPPVATGWGPMASVAFTPISHLSVVASVASRTRFPTLRERFSTVFGTREPNALLRPERAINLSLDVSVRPTPGLHASVGVFDSELTDLIQTVMVRPQTEQLQNVGVARYLGAEAEAQWTLDPWIDVVVGWMLLSAKGGAAYDAELVGRPDNRGTALLTVRPFGHLRLGALRGLSATGALRHVGEQAFQHPDTGAWGRLGSYQLFDARLDWALPIAPEPPTLFVRMTNVADSHVEGRFAFPEAGRQVFVGIASKVGS